jgi:hypothetical protein
MGPTQPGNTPNVSFRHDAPTIGRATGMTGGGGLFSAGAEQVLEGLGASVTRPADRRVLAAIAASAVFFDLAVRSGLLGVAGALTVLTWAVAFLATGRVTNPQARFLVALSPVFGSWLVVRASPWLVPLDILAAAGLLGLGASFATGGSVLDLSLPQAVLRGVSAAINAVLTPAFAAGPLRRVGRRFAVRGRSAQAGAVLRGLLLAIPLVLLLGMLLASADVVFAGFVRPNVALNPVSLGGHVAALVLGAWAAAGLLRVASARPVARLEAPAWRLGTVEAAVVLASLVALFTVFAIAQLVVLAGGGRHVIETAGLTYAEYARSGFFQLLAVAVLTLVILMSVRAVTDVRRSAPLLGLSVAAVALTLVIVAVAIRRMNLYEQVFGLTMLRLYVKLFCFLVGGVFVLLGLALVGVGPRRAWFVPSSAILGLALLLALNVADPEAYVVRHNVAFAQRSHRFDPAYLAGLSDDAVPALLAAIPSLGARARAAVYARLCPRGPSQWQGWAAFNLARHRADVALTKACVGHGSAVVTPVSAPPTAGPATDG